MAAAGGWGKLLDDRPPTQVLVEAQKYVRDRLEKKWLPQFLTTPEFAERQRPHGSMDDVVEDVLIQKKKKSQAIWRVILIMYHANLGFHIERNFCKALITFYSRCWRANGFLRPKISLPSGRH